MQTDRHPPSSLLPPLHFRKFFILQVLYIQIMVSGIQQTPQTPSYTAPGIQVPANIASPEATMNSVKDQQGQLNAVNNLTSGGGRRHTRGKSQTQRKGRGRGRGRASVIRTYKGRRYQSGGNAAPIAIPQVGSTCSSGPQCAGSQNAALTSINNQAQSDSINDAYAKGGRRRHKKVRFTHGRRHGHRQYSMLSTATYKLKKFVTKVFS